MKTLKQYTKNIFLMSDVNIIVIMKIVFKKIFNFFLIIYKVARRYLEIYTENVC